MTEVTCAECGTAFSRYPSQVRDRNYCSRSCLGKWRSRQIGPLAAHWKGGARKDRNRVMVYAPDHPMANTKGYVYRYQIVAEEKIGRPLARGEVVHHKNGDEADDTPENLEVLASQAEHARIHGKQRTRDQMEAMRRARREVRAQPIPDQSQRQGISRGQV